MQINAGLLLPLLFALPVLSAGVCQLLKSALVILRFCVVGVVLVSALVFVAVVMVFRNGMILAAGNWLMLDALSAYHAAVMMTVFVISAFFAVGYFREEIDREEFTLKTARRYGSLWFGAMGAMMLVLVSNNLGIMWVGIESTTLLTAFLICIHMTPGALEAMWKYLMMCSVGVAAAFTGILLAAASTGSAGINSTDALLWTNMMASVSSLNPVMVKAAFIFIVVGYGTKAGLAPMHNWLPDAHSQAPGPVSAIFSGFLLNAALYCIIRFLPIVEASSGNTGWGRGILVVFGLLSILVAAVFILGQHDVKRMLAYHSVEHIGIISVGVGLGGLGVFAALFHVFNHSICKALSFCCAGRVGQVYGTHDMHKITGILRNVPIFGTGLICGILALIGIAPFAIFMSEFMMLKAAVDSAQYWTAAAFLVGAAVVFIGALSHAISMAWKSENDGNTIPVVKKFSILDAVLVFVPLAILLVLGLWMPQPLAKFIIRAAVIVGGLS
ncbi:MAG: proton-conducting transporter membrane subunit [Kiritimatiellae bacterium]|nr:proton-conducting transporter membrane subunit [Kiritimatiellia bacterium]MDD5520085.1 proton-conducting transporter membrane subunit [Kiritimatiellia bacterium]